MTDPTASSAPIAAPKADPETLVLRAAPGRVTRFRRGAIVAIGVVMYGVNAFAMRHQPHALDPTDLSG